MLETLHADPELPGMTVSTVRGFGRAVGRQGGQAGHPVQYGTVEMTKLECVVHDEDLDGVVDMIQSAAHTGNVGDGKIFVYEILQVVRIRTKTRTERIE